MVLDGEAARLLDEQTGELTSGDLLPGHVQGQGQHTHEGGYVGGGVIQRAYGGDTGGASRFFYCAKSSRGERNAGLEGLNLPPESATYEWGDDKKVRTCDDCGRHFANNFETCPRCGGGWSWQDGLGGGVKGPRGGNHHPTVKPISLMRWLVRLVTPPAVRCRECLGTGKRGGSTASLADRCAACDGAGTGPGLVLDPFAGSGTTGCACALEAFDFVGLEREPEYVAIAEARIAWWHKHRGDGEAAQILAAGEARDEVEATGQLGMFDQPEEEA